ncbi:hypothetical protein AHAS_Ahas02G0087300 [Arachis hypogaea]
MEASKPEEINHPPMDQLQGLEYCIDSNPSWGMQSFHLSSTTFSVSVSVTILVFRDSHIFASKLLTVESIALGFQHYILALGTAVMIPSFLVPLMGGSDDDKVRVVQTLLFVEGINTLLQTLFGTRLPTVVGGSYAYMVPIISIIHDSSLMKIQDPHLRFLNTMRAVQGAMIVASSIQIILGFSQLWAICSRFFSPLGMAPVIALVGFGLFDRGFPVVGHCVEIGIPMLVLFLAFSQVLLKFNFIMSIFHTRQIPILERFALLISTTIIWAYAHLLTASGAYKHRPELIQHNCRTDRANLISSAPWKNLSQSTGAYKGASRLASATPPPSHVLSRGIGWQGIGILLNGLLEQQLVHQFLCKENVGLLGSTRVGSRRVIQISAGFMIFFSMLGKFGAFFASIPLPIFAAAHCILFGLVASVGLSFLEFTNMNSLRNLFITGVALFLGLSIPEYFREYTAKALHGPTHTKARWFNDFLNTIFFSSPSVALIIAAFLDNTLDYKDSGKDRGMPWWAKFRSFKGDTRNEEFYTLPFNLNRFFPPS